MYAFYPFSETMRVCYRLPWRRLKTVVPILIIAAIVLYIQSNFFASKWQQKNNVVERRSDVQFKEGRLHNFANLANLWLPLLQNETSKQAAGADGDSCHCSDSYKPSADIYTYNLPDVTNYTLDKDREYFLPDPRKDIMKRKTSTDFDREPIQVILVPFSHADPGYGNTMEGYYVSKTKGKGKPNTLSFQLNICKTFGSFRKLPLI